MCIVGAGPAGLSAAIRLRQLAIETGNEDVRVVVLEKAGEVGAHIVPGNVLESRAIDELLPDWLSESNEKRFKQATPARKESMRFLTRNRSLPCPVIPQMHNDGNFIISLSAFTKWLGERAEDLGVEIYPDFAGAELVYGSDPEHKLVGVATHDQGVSRTGTRKTNFERGILFEAKVTLLAEGCHGSLTKQASKKFGLRKDSEPQTHGLGIKEVWEVAPEKFQSGHISHSLGYPLSKDVYGGGWMYHFGDGMVSVGLVVGLDYANPWMSPYQEFQKMKLHPMYRSILEGGKCIAYGARTISEGGLQSIPKCAFPGGALIGDFAGFLNVPKIKGTHTSMKSGMLAAEAAFAALVDHDCPDNGAITLSEYEEKLRSSWIWEELQEVRNMRPSFHSPLGVYGGMLYSGLDAYVLRGKVPWTLKHRGADHSLTKAASEFKNIDYPKPDGKITFDVMTSVSRTGTNHEEDQPVHLQVHDRPEHARKAFPRFAGVESRFCPAGVYEYVEDELEEHGVRFQINAQK